MALTDAEYQLIRNGDILLQKRAVLTKVEQVLSEVDLRLRASSSINSSIFPPGTLTRSGKISRGENYKGLPYLVLDYPRFSENDKVFIYRTMFWWGHYFLCLLVSANCGHSVNQNINETNDLLINMGSSPWNYDITEDGWVSMNAPIPRDLPFIAMARKIDFQKIDELPALSGTTFETLVSFLS